MPTLLFRSPDPDEQMTVTLEPGAAVLLGRHPDPGRLNRDGIPSFAKKFIKPRNTVVSIDDWNDFGDGTFGGTFTLDTHGVPVDIKGQTLLVANGDDKSDYTVTIDIKVSVPLIGGKLENFSKGIVNAQMDEEFRLGDAWLAEH